MRSVYKHFPINIHVPKDGKSIDIRNFLGEKMLRTVQMPSGVGIEVSKNVKDEIVLTVYNQSYFTQLFTSLIFSLCKDVILCFILFLVVGILLVEFYFLVLLLVFFFFCSI